ncbi:MAG: DUF952 domain-containing protein [Deltaproteobacteria bacterium]|nr:MAG: DUF952 domain-containing protein [Deltaproteobacteria bacterium]
MTVYKILLPAERDALHADGHTLGAPVDLADGFVHFSTAEQLEETARRHFAHVDRMWLLAVDGEALGDALKWEPSRGGALFPHFYAPLHAAHVSWEREVTRAEGTPWSLPELGA